MKVLYARNNMKYYARSAILITLILFLIALALEVTNVTADEDVKARRGI